MPSKQFQRQNLTESIKHLVIQGIDGAVSAADLAMQCVQAFDTQFESYRMDMGFNRGLRRLFDLKVDDITKADVEEACAEIDVSLLS